MKKIVRQQNYLKDLIESQDNPLLSKQALRCLIRGNLEPLLDNPEEGVVLHRISDTTSIIGLLKRLDFSDIKSFDYSDNSENLREKVWAKTEFLCVLTHRYVSILIWDYKTDIPNAVRYYSLCNSKLQNEALDIIDRNSKISLKEFQESFKPDRRDNILLNLSVRRAFEHLDEASKDAVLGFAQTQSEREEKEIDQTTRQIAHEVKNQLSICDLYTAIIKKRLAQNKIKDEAVTNALKNMDKAIKIAANSLIGLKSTEKANIKPHKLKELISNSQDLTKVYFEGKDVEYNVENEIDTKIPVDENKFISAIVNIVKNASEAFNYQTECPSNGKYVKIKTEENDDFILIRISNNAGKIAEPKKIFTSGFTTKSTGSGLGLAICKKTIEEMFCKLEINKNTEEEVEFLITIGKIK